MDIPDVAALVVALTLGTSGSFGSEGRKYAMEP